MTVRAESAHLTIESSRTDCGRHSCIILYSSENCFLCDAALKILYSVISDFGLPHSIIRKVDVLNDDDDDCNLPSPVGLPAIRICQDVILGLPDMDIVRSAVMHAVMNGCFSDCQ